MSISKTASAVSIAETLFLLPQFYNNYLRGLERLRSKKGDAFSFSFPKKSLFLMHPSHAHEVLVKNAKSFRKSDHYKASFGLFGDSLLTAEGEEWRKKRKVIAPEFHLSQISKFDDLFLRKIDAQIDLWRGQKSVDVFSSMQQFSFEVAGSGFFGAETGQQAKQVMAATQSIIDITMKRLFLPWLKPDFKKVNRSMAQIEEVVSNLVEDKKKKGSGCPVDVLKRLMDAGGAKDIRDQAVTILLAGHDTTTHSLTWMIHLLLWNPEQRRILEEKLASELGSDLPIGEKLDSLDSIAEVIGESLRLYPSIPVISRNALEDLEVCGVPVRKGELVQLSPWVTHRHPDYWFQPEKFDPARFENSKIESLTEGSYFPFGLGPRECVGEHFARRQMKVAVARIIQRSRISPASRKPTPARAVVLPHPRGPILMNVKMND